MTETDPIVEAIIEAADLLKERGYRIVKPVDRNYVGKINGREYIVIEDEL